MQVRRFATWLRIELERRTVQHHGENRSRKIETDIASSGTLGLPAARAASQQSLRPAQNGPFAPVLPIAMR